MDNFNKEYHRETHTIACNYSRSKDNVATNMLDSLVAGSLIVAGGLLLGPLGASLGAAYALTKKVVEVEKEKYSDKNRISSTEEDDEVVRKTCGYRRRRLLLSTIQAT